MTKRLNNTIDIATISTVVIVEEGKYFIDEEGTVRTASGKVKKTMVDTRGRKMVALEAADGDTVACYISDLLTDAYHTPDEDNFNLKALEAAKNSAGSKAPGTRRAKVEITVEETGEVFHSFAAVAKHFGWNYDKLYNSFYTQNRFEVEFNGVKLTLRHV